MSDAETIAAFTRDIAIIVFGVVGIVSFIIMTVVVVKAAKQVRIAVDRVNSAVSKVERILEIGNVIRDAVSKFGSSSKGKGGDGGPSMGWLFAPVAFVLRQLFRNGRRSKEDAG